jgi:hypothetical protein
MQPPTSYGDYSAGYRPPQPEKGASYDQGYNRGYGPGNYMPPPQGAPRQPNYGYPPPYTNQPPTYGTVNVSVYNNVNSSNKNTAALVVEVLLSLLFGIYGVGWLMSGETTIGILLLVGSFVLYWPMFILGTIFTVFLGLICLIPLGIAAVITNAILLNNVLNRKAAQVTVVVPPVQAQQMPPQYPR